MSKKVEWREGSAEGLYDLWVDGRIAEYDVPEDDMQDALHRARV